MFLNLIYSIVIYKVKVRRGVDQGSTRFRGRWVDVHNRHFLGDGPVLLPEGVETGANLASK